MTGYRKTFFILIFFFTLLTTNDIVIAEDIYDEITYDEEIYENYEFDEINEIMQEETGGAYSFTDMMGELFSGDDGVFGNIFDMIKNSVASEFEYNKATVVRIIALAICMSLLTNVLVIFNNNNYSDTGFYIVFLMLVNTLLGAFLAMSEVAGSLINSIVTFMKCLIPSFFLAVGVSNGYSTSTGLCAITLTVMSIMEVIILKILFPVISIYIAISLVSTIQKENKLSKIGDTINTLVNWSVKTLVAVVLGLNLIESLILPSADAVKNKGLTQVVSMIPGIGNSIGGAAKLAVSSGEIIKNTIGGTALLALVVIAAVPLLKLIVFTSMYRLLVIIVQPISDKRVVEGIDTVVKASAMLYRISTSSIVIFGASIAIICVFTGA